MTEYTTEGIIVRKTTGTFTVMTGKSRDPLADSMLVCVARGLLRKAGLVPGDRVEIVYTDRSFVIGENGRAVPVDNPAGVPDCAIARLLERKNTLIRPRMSNLDCLFIVCASARPDPDTLTTDKMLAVCEYYGIQAAIVVGKCELSPENTERIASIYTRSGYPVFPVSCAEKTGLDRLKRYIDSTLDGKTAAFSGASGVGKSSLLASLFPDLDLTTGSVSEKTGRGRHTTRNVELYPVSAGDGSCMIADTPGFSLMDFENFDFLPFEALDGCFPDFRRFYADCRYADCTHTREKECGVALAIGEGKISATRRESYIAMYDVLKNKNRW